VFEDPDRINGYAHFLQSLGPALWAVRIVLLACVALHVWAATVLTLENRRARGDQPYAVKTWIQATVASRYMRWTGYVVLAFIVYHLAQFTEGAAQPQSFKENIPRYTMKGDYHVLGFAAVRAGTRVLDVRSMVILGFGNPVVALFYIVAVGLLSLHLLHGADSLFQTLGWRNRRWERGLRATVTVACAAYFLGNLAIPGGVLLGVLR
jgi:succinate dehydrogenase / fumarate reductase cytochrome b subunit